MSRRTIIVLAVCFGGLLLANLIVLAVWLPSRKTSAPAGQAAGAKQVTAAASPTTNSPNNSASPANRTATATVAPQSRGDVVMEPPTVSSSGKLRIKYTRDRKTKRRQIAVEDPSHTGTLAVLYESQRSAWALVSPDDQWIAVNERDASDGGGARLYRRTSNTSLQFEPAEPSGTNAPALRDVVWKSYLESTHADQNTPRRGVTIDATGWDGAKVNVSVTHLATAENPDVPEPWSGTYDVASKQAAPVPDQAVASDEPADDSPAGGNGDESNANNNVAEDGAAGNSVADASEEAGDDADAEVVDDNLYPGEKFPATRLDELTVPDVNESSLSEITYAINEMFARHGAEFKDRKVAKEFAAFPWYKPRPGIGYDQIEKEFNDLEKANVKVLGRCRDAKLAAAHRKSRPVQGERVRDEPSGEEIMRGVLEGLGGSFP